MFKENLNLASIQEPDELYAYESIDGIIWAWLNIPDDAKLITTMKATKDIIKDILENWDMTIPIKAINNIKNKSEQLILI